MHLFYLVMAPPNHDQQLPTSSNTNISQEQEDIYFICLI